MLLFYNLLLVLAIFIKAKKIFWFYPTRKEITYKSLIRFYLKKLLIFFCCGELLKFFYHILQLNQTNFLNIIYWIIFLIGLSRIGWEQQTNISVTTYMISPYPIKKSLTNIISDQNLVFNQLFYFFSENPLSPPLIQSSLFLLCFVSNPKVTKGQRYFSLRIIRAEGYTIIIYLIYIASTQIKSNK